MIIEFLLSLFLLCLTSSLCILTSGGLIWELFDFALLPGLILILGLMIFLSGYGKAFVRIFLPAKKMKNAGLAELKKAEASLDYTFKALFFISVFLMLISGIYFYLNFDNTQTLGVNLATILLSFYYMSFFGMLFITLKAKIKKNIINFMAEDGSKEKPESIKSPKKVLPGIIKILLSLAMIAFLYILIIYFSTTNLSNEEPLSFYYLRDLPGLIYIFIPTFLLLTISGNFKNFFKALGFVFKDQKLTVSQKAVSVNAISTLRSLMFLEGIMASLCGFIGMLFNLEDRSALGINFAIACVPLIYGLLINLILLPVESKICLLCDSE